jgi:hypothetical protein
MNSQKNFNILLGAGFSKALGNLPTTDGIENSLSRSLADRLLFLRHKLNIQGLNYEGLTHYVYTYRKVQKLFLDRILGDGIIDILNSECDTYLEAVRDTLYSELHHSKINNESQYVKYRSQFTDFIKKLLEDYTVNIIDLNHDQIVENCLCSISDYSNYFDTNNPVTFDSIDALKSLKFYPLNRLKLNKFGHPIDEQEKEVNPKDYYNSLGLSLFNNVNYKYQKSKLNHLKIHGALNIVYLSKDMLQKADGFSEDQYPFYLSDEPFYVPNFQNSNYVEGISTSLIVGMDKAVKLFQRNHLSHHTLFAYECISSYDPLLIIGYGGHDDHINSFVRNRHFFDSKTGNIKFFNDGLASLLGVSNELESSIRSALEQESQLFEKFLPILTEDLGKN